MIADPVEETFPFQGHVEFLDMAGAPRWRLPRAEDVRERYRERLAAQRDAVARGGAARAAGTFCSTAPTPPPPARCWRCTRGSPSRWPRCSVCRSPSPRRPRSPR